MAAATITQQNPENNIQKAILLHPRFSKVICLVLNRKLAKTFRRRIKDNIVEARAAAQIMRNGSIATIRGIGRG